MDEWGQHSASAAGMEKPLRRKFPLLGPFASAEANDDDRTLEFSGVKAEVWILGKGANGNRA